MLDSIEINPSDKNNINSFAAINQLKQGLKQNSFQKNDVQENKKSTQSQNNAIDTNTNNNKLSQSERIKTKISKSLNKRNSNGKQKSSYINFIRNIRAATPELNNLSNSNVNPNKNKNRPTSTFTRTLNNFFQRNKLLINDDDDKSSIINDDPIKLRNR